MATVESDDQNRLNSWLAMLYGQGREARDEAIAEMRTAGAGRLLSWVVRRRTH